MQARKREGLARRLKPRATRCEASLRRLCLLGVSASARAGGLCFSVARGFSRRAALVRGQLLLLLVLLTGCSLGGATLANVSASTGEITPGSTGIGKPPGAVEVRYTLGR